ncbi:DNA polymerase-3 subunit epsilon [Propionibacterium cyclohexanicum]|uniref:DNA polymerase-3 subunit epsilon n=1 Tax=Propionibacterium cyclohexanicum TaxID=64702 RepID=A0A1H9T376_9ACTN|nr:3'-5' exonuclease [Propionibacterium cyclohexanicum]SER91444.1 DNA polymerase-3 subunit epsilon [Propionibacterium cyclohexanicum]
MPGYAVLDLETTGFSWARGDRIVEIGIVALGAGGEPEGEWTTLVNPQRMVGATRVHHITTSDVADAPTMGELAPQLVEQLRGRIVVAHNCAFDVPFLVAELTRAGVPLPGERMPQLCTMRLSHYFLEPASRRLEDCCRAAGIRLVDAHSALGDARAAAQLLVHYMNSKVACPPWQAELNRAPSYRWPELSAGGAAHLLPRR